MSIETLITQASNKDYTNANITFETLIGEKMKTKLDQRKVTIADSVYKKSDQGDE